MNNAVATIDGRNVEVRRPCTILDAAASLAIDVPTLCHVDGLPAEGGCRMCLVELDGAPRPVAACHTLLAAGMVIRTTTPALDALRRGLLELTLAELRAGGFEPRADGCRFEALLHRFGVQPNGSGRRADPAPHAVDETHPYLRYDASRCITCRACLNSCAEIQGQFVYGIAGRGAQARLIFGPTERFADSPCVACGACVDQCPTGALRDRDRCLPASGLASTDTTCPYCGVGCQVRVEATANAVVRIRGVPDAAVNHGHLCVKGRFAHAYHRSPERLTTPLLREGDRFRPLGWPAALDWAARRLTELRNRHGPDALGVLTSARSTNEAAYLLQKLFRTAIGTNNVDCCARVCHASTAVALHRSTGSSAGSASFDDIERAGCIVVAGSNATEGHPVVGARIRQAVLRGTPLIVIDPRRIELAELARLHLPVLPNTNVPLFNAIAKLLIEQRRYDAGYVAARCEGFDELAAFLAARSLAELARPTGVSVAAIRAAAELIGARRPVLFVHGIGLSELTQGTTAVMALINLGMLTGSIGRPGAGMLPLRGQNNVQGNVDMGATPSRITGDLRLDDPEVRARLTAIWGQAPPARPGHKLPGMLAAAAAGTLRGLWVQGFDLAQSAPYEAATLAALQRLELLIVQDIFFCETCRYAHLVLPAAAALEQDGTFTNAERRMQLVRPVVSPPGEARAEWRIVRDVAAGLGADWPYSSAADVMDEIARVAPSAFGGISHARLAGNGLQWPCPHPTHPGTPTVHAEGFVRGRGRLAAIEYAPSPEEPDAEYPFLLITGRRLEHFNVGTMTRRAPDSGPVRGDYLEIHPDDAARAGVVDGARVALQSRWGATQAVAQLTSRVSPGTLFLTFHFPETHANRLTSPYVDPQSGCPEYKRTAVRIGPG